MLNTTPSRLSYASSPESDLEMSPGPSAALSLGNLPALVKSSSDPSIATTQELLDRNGELSKMLQDATIGAGGVEPPPYTTVSSQISSHPSTAEN